MNLQDYTMNDGERRSSQNNYQLQKAIVYK